MKNKFFYSFSMIYVFFTIVVRSQSVDSSKQVLIESIILNNQEFVSKDKITITDSDNLVVRYKLKDGNSASKDPLLFTYSLISEKDTSNKSIGTTQLSLGKLIEGSYKLNIGAFDLQRRWTALHASLLIEVDNEKAKLKRQSDSLIKKNADLLAKAKESESDSTKSTKSGSIFVRFGLPIIYIIVAIIGIGIIFLLILVIKKKMKGIGNDKVSSVGETHSNEEFEKLELENSALRAELAALRGQVEVMQMRGDQLSSQNKELQKSVNKLSSSKVELEELQKQKDDLFAVIIHDIKNPASLIKSLVELLTSYDLTAVEQQEIIHDIALTTIKIVSLSQEVSKILALETNKLYLNIDNVSINDVADDVLQRNSVASGKKGLKVIKEFEENIPYSDLDHQKIDEVIDNLLSNAIKFTPNGGSVIVRTYAENSSVVVEVKDNGLGLTEEDIKHSFQRGARLSAKPTAGESSSGLGLWIVKKLIDAHHGKVWVKSAVGKGSTFAFSVPFKQPEEVD